MRAAMRSIHYLGFRVAFLLGTGFKTTMETERNYAFEQGRTRHAVDLNNRLYAALDRRFIALRKCFNDFWVFNCTRGSGLTAFPYYPYNKACRILIAKPIRTGGLSKRPCSNTSRGPGREPC